MIFAEPMVEAILSGRKTQTRRRSGRYVVGRTYAVQPGRGKAGEGRIAIVARRRERLGSITTQDAIAEGFDSRARFFEYWTTLHGGVDRGLWVYAYTFELVDP